jgi:hypothetical protein
MYYIKIAKFCFTCPISGEIVRIGDVYMENENGSMFHISQLPARKLKPLKSAENAI